METTTDVVRTALGADEASRSTAETADGAATPAAVRECPGCIKPFEPGMTVLLPCCHVICRGCVASHVTRSQAAQQPEPARFICPRCGTAAGSLDPSTALATDPFTELELLPLHHCSVCADDDNVVEPAVARCVECAKELCAGHKLIHSKRTTTRGHSLEPLKSAGQSACEQHGEPVIIYCIQCEAVACVKCALAHHNQHATADLVAHAHELRARLAAAHQGSTDRSALLTARIEAALTATARVNDERGKAAQSVRSAFEALERALVARRTELLNQLDALAVAELQAIEVEINADRRRLRALQDAERMALRLQHESSDDVYVGRLAVAVANHLRTESQAVLLHNPIHSGFQFGIAAGAGDAFSQLGRLTLPKAFGPSCKINGEALKVCYADATNSFVIEAHDRNGDLNSVGGDAIVLRITRKLATVPDSKPTAGQGSATMGPIPPQTRVPLANSSSGDGQVASEERGSAVIDAAPALENLVSSFDVVDGGNGSYTVAFRVDPTVPVNTDLTMFVDVNGLPILGSPFTVVLRTAWAHHPYSPPVYYDNKGILYHLATAGGTRPWVNPCDSGVVKVDASSTDEGHVRMLVGNRIGSDFFTANQPGSWVMMTLPVLVKPTAYVLSYRTESKDWYPRHWVLEGSRNIPKNSPIMRMPGDDTWIVLSTHTNDHSLNAKCRSASWQIPATPRGFNVFRIRSTGPDSNGEHFLVVSGFEVYGDRYMKPL